MKTDWVSVFEKTMNKAVLGYVVEAGRSNGP